MSTYYVRSGGSDGAAGTSVATAFATIQKGLDTAAAADTVDIGGGTFNLTAPLVMDGKLVNLTGVPGATIVDGGLVVGSWSNIGGEVWRATYSDPSYNDFGQAENCSGTDVAVERSAILHVDDGNSQSFWLRPRDNGTSLARGEFYTNSTGHSGGSHQITCRLADGGDPNSHTMRIGGVGIALLFDGNPSGSCTIQGIEFRRAENHLIYGQFSGTVTVQGCNLHWCKGFCIGTARQTGAVLNVRNNYIHHYEYEAVHCEMDNSTIESNLIETAIAPWSVYGAMGVNVTQGDNATIQLNTIRGMLRSTGGTGGSGIQLEDWYRDGAIHTLNAVIQRNTINANGGHGITGGGTGHAIKNNLIYDNGLHGISEEQGSGGGSHPNNATGWTIYHNTIVNNGQDPVETYGSGVSVAASCTATVKNNILYENDHGATSYSGTVTSTNNYTSDPLFVSYAGRDLRLTSASPARNGGANLGVTVDFNGAARDTVPDIGAYEYGATAPTTSPPIIDLVSPSSGAATGGTLVTLTGANFSGATGVTFGGVPGTGLSVISSTGITVIAPAHAVGAVSVVVTTPAGSSAAAVYTYTAPAAGLLSVATPLVMNRTGARLGQTITGTVVYKNETAGPISYQEIVIGGRPPGGTNDGGPFGFDLAPVAPSGTLAAGASVTVTASRTVLADDPPGDWYFFATWRDASGVTHDAPAAQNKTVTVDPTAPGPDEGGDPGTGGGTATFGTSTFGGVHFFISENQLALPQPGGSARYEKSVPAYGDTATIQVGGWDYDALPITILLNTSDFAALWALRRQIDTLTLLGDIPRQAFLAKIGIPRKYSQAVSLVAVLFEFE